MNKGITITFSLGYIYIYIYIYNSSFGPPFVIHELSHGSRYYSWRWPSRVHLSYIIKF